MKVSLIALFMFGIINCNPLNVTQNIIEQKDPVFSQTGVELKFHFPSLADMKVYALYETEIKEKVSTIFKLKMDEWKWYQPVEVSSHPGQSNIYYFNVPIPNTKYALVKIDDDRKEVTVERQAIDPKLSNTKIHW
ncbi:unnamed protein product [Didymodactylos carnosus]|uniref:Uncharacterized protein n=1 Tax=Didymodactylos carnosus TaxID=1234261 RepID=A0A8S2G3A0_9BILA|nr:unnamed protein product [Didymodactylos carnosus]CAF4441157.1 unnamed protein product [Didymodactylos carnosus]